MTSELSKAWSPIPGKEFVEFPKIPRLSRDIVITEKIDGTNAQIYIPEAGDADTGMIYAASRNRWISPADDNHGFARWVQENKEELLKLGPGSHFGEWWGAGVGRRYDLKEKRFSLFNVHRWSEPSTRPVCCGVVPTLYRGPFLMEAIENELTKLRENGSTAAPGFMRPEGVVIFHTVSGILFKKTIEKDEQPKGKG